MEASITEKLLWAAPNLGGEAEALARKFVADGLLSMDDLKLLTSDILTTRYNLPFFQAVAISAKLQSLGNPQAQGAVLQTEAAAATDVVFTIPWRKFPPTLLETVRAGQIPTEADRLSMVQRIVEDVRHQVPHAERAIFVGIAEKIHKKYPTSFGDAAGRSRLKRPLSLTAQLQNCFDNKRRGERTRLEKEAPPRNTLAYGCTKWQLESLPAEETERTQEKRQALVRIYETQRRRQWDWQEILELMNQTYGTQRRDINKISAVILELQNAKEADREPRLPADIDVDECTVEKISELWPFLMLPKASANHFCHLTGKNLEEVIPAFLEEFAMPLMDFFSGQKKASKQVKRFKALYEKYKNDVNQISLQLLTVLLMLTDHLKEEIKYVIATVCDGTTVENFSDEYETRSIPKTPTIYAVGKAYKAKKFYVTVDQKIETVCKTYQEAFNVIFSCYFIFGMSYPTSLSLVLDFVQRAMVGINPDRGTKTKTKKNTNRKFSVSTKVLTLLRRFNIQLQEQQIASSDENEGQVDEPGF